MREQIGLDMARKFRREIERERRTLAAAWEESRARVSRSRVVEGCSRVSLKKKKKKSFYVFAIDGAWAVLGLMCSSYGPRYTGLRIPHCHGPFAVRMAHLSLGGGDVNGPSQKGKVRVADSRGKSPVIAAVTDVWDPLTCAESGPTCQSLLSERRWRQTARTIRSMDHRCPYLPLHYSLTGGAGTAGYPTCQSQCLTAP